MRASATRRAVERRAVGPAGILALLACTACGTAGPWPELRAPIDPGPPTEAGARATESPQRRIDDIAVIVDIEAYENLPDVPGAGLNGDDWVYYFEDVLGLPPTSVRRLRNGRATPEEVLAKLRQAATGLSPHGQIWFVFIGHGTFLFMPAEEAANGEEGQKSLLVMGDAETTENGMAQSSVEVDEVLQAVGDSAYRLILDACFTGRVPGIQGPIWTTRAALTDKRNGVILTATAGDETAAQLPHAARPSFSYLVLGGLRGWADGAVSTDDRCADDERGARDGRVTPCELTAYTRGMLAKTQHGHTQTPTLAGDFAPDLALAQGGFELGPDPKLIEAYEPPVPPAAGAIAGTGAALLLGGLWATTENWAAHADYIESAGQETQALDKSHTYRYWAYGLYGAGSVVLTAGLSWLLAEAL